MIRFLLAVLIWTVVLFSNAFAGTRVWFHYGAGDNIFNTSIGIDEMAASAAKMAGVVQVTIHDYWQTQLTADEVLAAPPGDRIIIAGYSCGANASTAIAYGVNPRRKVDIAIIQESIYCGGNVLLSNVNRAQETYAEGFAGCLITLGLGCKTMVAGPGFNGQLVLIDRPDLHPWADTDINAQNDVLSFIAGSTPTLKMRAGPRVMRFTRYNGQGL